MSEKQKMLNGEIHNAYYVRKELLTLKNIATLTLKRDLHYAKNGIANILIKHSS